MTEELKAKIKSALPNARIGKMALPGFEDEDVYTVTNKFIPMVIKETEKAYAEEIRRWGQANGYEVGLLDEAKVREVCERMKPIPPKYNRMIGVWQCGKCGHAIQAGFSFCHYCGVGIGWNQTG